MSWGDVRTVENWREDALPGQTHDPHEVTVQLDGAGRLLGEMIAAGRIPADAGSLRAPGDDKEVPVFVDDSGRRSRTFRRVGVALGLACAVYAVVIVITMLSGSSSAPWLPGLSDGKKASDKVDTTPQGPADSASPTTPADRVVPDPSGSGATPGASGTPEAGASPSPGAGTDDKNEPGTGTTGKPGKPTGGSTTKPADPSTPAGGGGSAPTTDPATPPTDPETPVDPPADPPADTTTGGGGTDTVADGTSVALPVELSPEGPVGEPSASFLAS